MKEFRVKFDNALAERFREGDARAFTHIHDHDFRKYVYYSFQITQDKDAAVSIVTEAYVKLWKLHANFNTLDDIAAFLYTVVRNDSYTFNRDRTNQRKSLLLVSDVETALPALEEDYNTKAIQEQENEVFLFKAKLHARLNEKIHSLPKQRRKVILLIQAGLNHEQIAQKLRISVNAVKLAKAKAIAQLRNELTGLAGLLFLLGNLAATCGSIHLFSGSFV